MTLRPANGMLYLAATLLILAAAAYSLAVHLAWYQQVAAVAAVLIALPWGGHYVFLRYIMDEQGITRKSLFGTRRINWGADTRLSLTEEHTQETSRLVLHISSGSQHMELSSDILPLEQVEELVETLRRRGTLPPQGAAENEVN